MLPHYKCSDCCSRCRQKGIFKLDEGAIENWSCPFNEVGCQSALKQVSWFELNKTKLIKGGAVLIILWSLWYWVTGGDGSAQLKKDVATLQADAKDWKKGVDALPQNRGFGDPYIHLWKDKIEHRTSKLKETPSDGIKQDIEKLNEELVRLDGELKKTNALKIPTVKSTAVNTQYEQARKEGKLLNNEVSKLNSKARVIDEKPIKKSLTQIDQQIKKGVGVIIRKSKPEGDAPVVDLNASKEDYVSAVDVAKTQVKNAILEEVTRREEAERKRLAAIKKAEAEAAARSLAEKLKAWNDAKPVIRISCSSAMEERLIIRLIEGYYESDSGSKGRLVTHPSHRRYVTTPKQSIEVGQSLKGGGNDALSFNLDRRKGEGYITNVIALDAMVALVPQSQPVSKITQFELEKVMAGKINNWQALGGLNSPIHLVIPKIDSDEGQVVDAATRALLKQNARKSEVDSVVAQLASNSSALGIGAFHNSVNQKRLIISSSDNDAGFAPSPSSIATEDYRYSKRVFGHSSKQRTPDAEKFMEFVLSDKGQKIIAEAGYIDMRPNGIPYPKPPKYVEDAIGADNILAAYKINSNFRFALDSSDLDIKARGDVERVKDSLTLHLNKKKECLLVGFTDNQGAADYNLGLSRKRASHVSSRIMSSSIRGNITTSGCGMDWPIADNDTHRGKAQNRRVEVWIIETR